MFDALRAGQDELAAHLDTSRRAASACGEAELAARIQAQLRALRDQPLRIALVGEFKAGKSTLANAMLGRDLLPTAVRECSPAVARVRGAKVNETEGASIRRADGSTADVPLAELDELLRLPLRPEDEPNGVEEAEVRVLDCSLLQEGIELVDTPGVSAAGLARERATLGFLPLADVIIFVTRADQLLPETEVRFLLDRVLDEERARLFLVVNRADEIGSPQERVRLLARVRQELAELDRALPVHFVAAADAVDALDDADDQALADSGFPEFLSAVATFLREDRATALLELQRSRAEGLRSQLVQRVSARLRNSQLEDQMVLRRRDRLMQTIAFSREDGEKLVADLQRDVDSALRPALHSQVRRHGARFQSALESQASGGSPQRSQVDALAKVHGGRALSAIQGELRRQLEALRSSAAVRLQELFDEVEAKLGGESAPAIETRLTFDDLVVIRTEQYVERRPGTAAPASSEAVPLGAGVGAALGAAIFGPFGAIAGAMLGAWMVGDEGVRSASATAVESLRSRQTIDARTSAGRLEAQLKEASETAVQLAARQLLDDVRAIVRGRIKELEGDLSELERGGVEPSLRPTLEGALRELQQPSSLRLPAP